MKRVITSADAPAAIGPYSQAIEANGMLFISGQLPLCPKTGAMAEDITEQTEQVFRNLSAILTEADYNFDNVAKTTVYLADMADFGAMNEVYARWFTGDKPARAAFQVARLPKDARVEIELIAVKS